MGGQVGGLGGWGDRGRGQAGCEQRIEVFVKIQKKKWGVSVRGWQRGCQRSEVFVKIEKKMGVEVGGRGVFGLGARVDVNEELKFL